MMHIKKQVHYNPHHLSITQSSMALSCCKNINVPDSEQPDFEGDRQIFCEPSFGLGLRLSLPQFPQEGSNYVKLQ
jgi:hypothetical protein